MGSKHRPKHKKFESDSYSDPYDEYEDELDDDLNDIGNLSRDFYSTDWENPSGSEKRFSTRRKIERRNDMKALYSQFDDWDEVDLGNEW